MTSKQKKIIEQCGGALWVKPVEEKNYSRCFRCGKRLRSVDAQIRGYGKVCWKKHLLDSQQELF